MGDMSLPPALKEWAEMRIAQRGYVDLADYIGDLVRRDRDAATKGWTDASHRSSDAG